MRRFAASWVEILLVSQLIKKVYSFCLAFCWKNFCVKNLWKTRFFFSASCKLSWENGFALDTACRRLWLPERKFKVHWPKTGQHEMHEKICMSWIILGIVWEIFNFSTYFKILLQMSVPCKNALVEIIINMLYLLMRCQKLFP